MVKPFRFARLPLIFFGSGKIAAVPGAVKKSGRNIILITGKESFLSSVYAENLLSSFQKEDIRYNHVTLGGEPSPEMIDSLVDRFRVNHIDAVVGIGGGSVLDAGKAISAMITVQGSVKNFLEGIGTRDHPGTKIPFIALPTTSGTGSEATKNAVISQTGNNGFKRSLRHDNFVPDIAIIDPDLTLSCPPGITAAGGMDCFTQLTEAFLSDKSNEYTDALAWEGLKAVKASLIRCFYHGNDRDARAGMSFAALTSGICLANAGLGVVHGFASSIGGMYDIPHGLICGTLMASANTITVRVLRKNSKDFLTLKKYARLGELFLDQKNRTDDFYIDGFMEYLQKITSDLGLPRLKQLGIDLSEIGDICEKTEVKNNPGKLNQDDLAEILSLRL